VAKSAIQTFGKYQILERIATGGMAEIYKARLEGIGGFQRTFAIKRVLPHLSQNREYISMLVDEAKVAGLLSHANIVQILDLGQVEGVWYIAMEYVHGPDLGMVLERCRGKGIELPLPHTCFVAIELLKGLEYAHNRQVMRGGKQVPLNIIHRDVSPPNILLSTQGEIKLTDFGIARASHTALETGTGIIKGRYDYMSPEQAAGSRDLDQRSDLFSVGVVLYEMLTGVHPFRAETEVATIERIRQGMYRPASEVNPGVPFALEMIVDRALRVERSVRYPNATAFKDALDKFFHDAGFLFSHQNLSSYITGLVPDFGETDDRRIDGALRGEPDRAGPPSDAFDDDAGPTRVIDKKSLPASAEPGDGPAFGLRRDETSTLVRKKALPPAWEDEPETLVRRTFDLRADEDPPTATTTTAAAESSGGLSPMPRRALTDPTPSPVGGRSLPAAASSAGSVELSPSVLAVGGLAAALTLLIGLFLGVAGGLLAAQTLGVGRGPAATPSLEIYAPRGVTVSIDGAVVEGSVELAPGVVHPVTVRDVMRVNVTLQPGEVRMLVIDGLPLGALPTEPTR